MPLAAHYHATMLVHKMVSLDDMDWRGWSIKVTAADGRSVLSVLFPQVSCFQSANSKIPRERHRPLEPKQAGMQRNGDPTKTTHGRIVCHTVQNTCPSHLRKQRRWVRLVAVTSLYEKNKKPRLDEPSFEMGASESVPNFGP